MKRSKILATFVAVGTLAVSASAQLVSFNFPLSSPITIPDGDLSGTSDKENVSGVPDSAGYVLGSVTFDLEGAAVDPSTGKTIGGVNGDMYLKLVHTTADGANTAYSILGNRVGKGGVNDAGGTGYSDNGMNVTLVRDGSQGAPSVDLHFYQNGTYTTDANGAVHGTFLADGRDIPPTSTSPAFGAAGRTSTLAAFDGLSMNGTWQLLLVDASSGGQEKLSSWGLTFTNVPEPYEYALIAGLGLLGFAAYRRFAVKAA